jgi:uncharacterized protein YfdQ (DUF2303 family)
MTAAAAQKVSIKYTEHSASLQCINNCTDGYLIETNELYDEVKTNSNGIKFRRFRCRIRLFIGTRSRRMRNVAETSGGSWDFLMIGLYD